MKVWVIGGTSGIGKAIAELLDEEFRCEVVNTGFEVPVQDFILLQEFLRKQEADRPFDAVVFSAGYNHLSWLYDGELTEFEQDRRVIEVNLVGFANVMRALASAPSGAAAARPLRVVAISSDAGQRPLRTSLAYCASKAGLDMAVRAAARELGPLGWMINAVSPGMVSDTVMTAYIDQTVPALRNWSREVTENYEMQQEVVAGRIHPNEVAQVVAAVLQMPPHMNGSIITFNGGR